MKCYLFSSVIEVKAILQVLTRYIVELNFFFLLPFYHQILCQDISHLPLPDVVLVAEHADPVELGRLLQLVLGCAVNCEQKEGVWLLLYYTLRVELHCRANK